MVEKRMKPYDAFGANKKVKTIVIAERDRDILPITKGEWS